MTEVSTGFAPEGTEEAQGFDLGNHQVTAIRPEGTRDHYTFDVCYRGERPRLERGCLRTETGILGDGNCPPERSAHLSCWLICNQNMRLPLKGA